MFSHLDRLYNRAYEISGISQLSATSLKPAGLESGVALREYSDIETERFVIVGQAYESAFLEIARQMIDLAKDVSEEGKTYEVISYGDKEIEKIRWSDINLREDQYRMKVYPASLLPTTPAARLQTVIEMAQAGLIDKAETRSLLDFPDIEQYNKLATAPLDEAECFRNAPATSTPPVAAMPEGSPMPVAPLQPNQRPRRHLRGNNNDWQKQNCQPHKQLVPRKKVCQFKERT